MTAREQLPAVVEKIARMLAVKPEYFVTHPAELQVVRGLSGDELRDLARENGWRVVRRIGGRQIEFYNDAGVNFRPL
jgi:predicted nucleic acid-binding OB-fold protein